MDRAALIEALRSGDRALRLHVIGVAGSGMSGLAALLMELGHRVSGCDKVTTRETERLQGGGLEFWSPHAAEALEGAEGVVFTSAVGPGNVSYDAAEGMGVPLVRRAEALAAIMSRRREIIVAGTHGKTTTSAMAAHVLRGAGLRPSHYVGAEIPILGANAHWDEGDFFVAEGDESDGSLVEFEPAVTLLLNVEADHLDHFDDGIDGIKRVFRTLLDRTGEMTIFCADDPIARELCAGRDACISYGFADDARYRAANWRPTGQSSEFDVIRDGAVLGRLVLNIPGRHNVSNALAVSALAAELGVPFEPLREAIAAFRGARRRFDVRYKSSRFMVVDDYGHHPTEIAATIEAARALEPKRVLVLFQPHRFTRTKLLRDQFGAAFDEADDVFVTDVYPASEEPIPGISGRTIAEEIENRGRTKAHSTPSRHDAPLAVGSALREGDLVLTLGAGNIHEAAGILARDLAVVDRLRDRLGDAPADVRLYEPMSKHTTMKLGGPAQFWIEPRSAEAFRRAVQFLREEGIPIRVVGRGSNLLVRDGGIAGAVICPTKGEFEEIRVDGNRITAGAGVRLKQLTAAARNAGIGGLEWMEGVPGNVGGALRMNAGAMGSETFRHVVSVTVLDRDANIVERPRAAIDARYRHVPELVDDFALSAVFEGTPAPQHEIDARLEESKSKRKASQPIAASAGCIFKNPDACPAGKLVDEIGFKNRSVGKARISEVHGNFLVNDGGASAADALALIEQIREAARRERGIELETEVQIVGQGAPILTPAP